MKYYITYNITLPYQVEIDADTAKSARETAKMMSQADILQSFAEDVLDYSNGSVDLESIMNKDGQYIYDGIGML